MHGMDSSELLVSCPVSCILCPVPFASGLANYRVAIIKEQVAPMSTCHTSSCYEIEPDYLEYTARASHCRNGNPRPGAFSKALRAIDKVLADVARCLLTERPSFRSDAPPPIPSPLLRSSFATSRPSTKPVSIHSHSHQNRYLHDSIVIR